MVKEEVESTDYIILTIRLVWGLVQVVEVNQWSRIRALEMQLCYVVKLYRFCGLS